MWDMGFLRGSWLGSRNGRGPLKAARMHSVAPAATGLKGSPAPWAALAPAEEGAEGGRGRLGRLEWMPGAFA
ncbi:hypothetical protein GCM10022229_17780 [Luteimonas lutimaris]|uniref:Uncharacterized protein n=1 Tax=Luteimonas lutimaris TaxID=698645 RepID=A0ABP7MJ51_9GAMM